MRVEHWEGIRAVAKTFLCSSAESGGMSRQTYVSWIGTGTYSSFRKTKRQLIAEAIAAVQSNSRNRELRGVDPLDVKAMAGITMTGTSTAFFKIPVTLDLIEGPFGGMNIQLCPQ
jgi:hypothetical protein